MDINELFRKGDAMKFKDRLSKLRAERKLTQKELSKELDISEQAISNYERGHRRPDNETLEKIANYFEVSVDYMLGRTDERSPADKIKKTISDDPELVDFFEELQRRDELFIMLKEASELPDKRIKQMIRIMKTFEEEQEDENY